MGLVACLLAPGSEAGREGFFGLFVDHEEGRVATYTIILSLWLLSSHVWSGERSETLGLYRRVHRHSFFLCFFLSSAHSLLFLFLFLFSFVKGH